MVRSWRRAGRRVLTAAVLSVAVGSVPVLSVPGGSFPGVAGPRPAAAADEVLRLGAPDLSTPGQVTVLATVPGLLTGRPLPADAFPAQQAGHPVPVTAQRVVDGPAELVLALDRSVPTDVLAAEQSAATDLLRSLPPELPTVVQPGGNVGTVRTALSDVAGLTAEPPGSTPAPLLSGLGPAPDGRRLFLVVAACDALGRLGEPATGSDGQVSVLAVGAGCEDRAKALADPTGGLVRTGLDAQSLQAAVDEAGRALLGQYRLQLTAAAADGPVEVTLASGGTTATGTVPLSAAPAAATEPARSRGPVVAAVALLALLVLGLVALAGFDRRRDRRVAAS